MGEEKCTPIEKILGTHMRKGPPPYVGMGPPEWLIWPCGEWEWSDDGECADDAKPKVSAAASSIRIIGQLILAIPVWIGTSSTSEYGLASMGECE